jgi:hypothetical protein
LPPKVEVKLAGAHMEREARYERDGLAPTERDALILKLRKKGWTQAAIGAHVGMTQVGVHHALNRLAGIRPKPRARVDDCAGETADDDDAQFWAF